MVRGKSAKAVRSKVRGALRTAKRTPKAKLNKMYAIVSGKLVAQTITKKKVKRRTTRSRKRRY